MSTFSEDIKKFNGIYKLPVSATPTLDVGVPAAERMAAFKDILMEEVHEMDEIIAAQQAGKDPLEVLTMLADLLGDIQVYCASEMAKFGLPLDQVLSIIMQSNFSKLGADGLPIYDERGKVMKGPNYWKPEPKLQAMLTELAAPNSSSE
ncbi:pyrophosphatase [Undibacterium seohonense]|jgi:predicted HAD superfamily Cof-like phosphohydrolase|uniref:Pyrophosphatase n=1 Tax=Undibacterium seohonense TaxID=1344950 RepID=A0ABR6X084_9BURK|nr:pyrophosphatase [Undibacterium seohonense]MBC3806317.1 pyrophosphatase [Undibacterium seohonense]